jgi:deoxyribodipyrimidine photo-lyase
MANRLDTMPHGIETRAADGSFSALQEGHFTRMAQDWIGTRAQALAAMTAFEPAMGRRYANGRNYDHGPGRHTAVSGLSPYVRRRLVTEQEVVTAAVTRHGADAAEKFIQEVVWRSYFKGWLERRPQVWARYTDGLEADYQRLATDRRLRREVERAVGGQTGLACFDAWVEELVDTGYLHNHARMWFASIWIFTFGLPWRLGADFFYRHLLDGDAASNTLGWRWVAGLHTRGKPYEAKAWNITTFTNGRFTPRDSDFNAVTEGLESEEPDGLPPLQPLRTPSAPKPGVPTLLLITDEDCQVETFDLASLDIRAAVTLASSHLRSPGPVAEAVGRFEAEALQDAAARAGIAPIPLRAEGPDTLADAALKAGAVQIVTPFITRGPLKDWLDASAPRLSARGITFAEWRRPWDSAVWPHATAGFFKVKERIPQLLSELVPA